LILDLIWACQRRTGGFAGQKERFIFGRFENNSWRN
jgi:hypothetical protein